MVGDPASHMACLKEGTKPSSMRPHTLSKVDERVKAVVDEVDVTLSIIKEHGSDLAPWHSVSDQAKRFFTSKVKRSLHL